jgi:hypothetical protein
MSSGSHIDPPAMQSAIHGEVLVDGQDVYVVIHDGVVTLYEGSGVTTQGAGTLKLVRWQDHIAVDRLTFAHDEGRKWRARVAGHESPR